MKYIGTCRNCEKRTVGCHATCEEYILAKGIFDAEQLEIRKNKAAYHEYATAKMQGIQRMKTLKKSNKGRQ